MSEFICQRAGADKSTYSVVDMERACEKLLEDKNNSNSECVDSSAAARSVARDLRNIGDELCGLRLCSLHHRSYHQHIAQQQRRTEMTMVCM